MAWPVRRGDERLGRWDPFREIEDAWSRMGSLLGDVVGAGEGRPFGSWTGWAVPVDIEETDEAFVVKVDLPGVRSEDVSLDLRETELHVAGEIQEPEREGQVRRQNRRTGRFDYRITLPGEVNPDAVEATLADGVLTVRLEKAPQALPRRIDVKPGG